ncbi:MAG: tryptophan-rich sensory protein [Candidatus Pacearchaeota archaeon]|nr:tryptophan-rich sensory protein [Candidatus Pacearchaeota archaeon]
MKKRINWRVLIISLIIVYAVTFIGGLFTSGSVNSSWYQQIKPSITPPNFVFPIVWNVLFFLIAISLYLSWINAKSKKEKISITRVFGINLFLNVCWSVLFFGLKSPSLAFFELILFWISIIFMIKVTLRINETAGYLIIPYLLWVSFAGILNYLSAF